MNWMSHPALPAGMILCAKYRPVLKVHSIELDNEWIASEKKRQLAQPLPFFKDGYRPSFLSTNDVICAWFMRHFECDHIFVPTNLRGRDSVMHSNMAGNLITSIVLASPEEYTSAAGYRRALEREPRFRGYKDTPPSLFRTLNFNGATISNWTTFYKQVELGGGDDEGDEMNAVYGVHFPLGDPQNMAMFRESGVIFNLTAQRTVLTIITRCKSDEQEMERFVHEQGIGKLIKSY